MVCPFLKSGLELFWLEELSELLHDAFGVVFANAIVFDFSVDKHDAGREPVCVVIASWFGILPGIYFADDDFILNDGQLL